MKNIISALLILFTFVNISIAMTDTREYVDWNDYPNIVKIIKSNSYGDTVVCVGTEVGKYVITSAQCLGANKKITIHKNNGTSVSADLEMKGEYKPIYTGFSYKTVPNDDWAILSLPENTESKYEMVENITSDSGVLYGFGDLRILTDEELEKVRQYMEEYDNENTFPPLSIDEVVLLLHQDIPGVGEIYGDGDKLKKNLCSGITKSNEGIEASCFWSNGNDGGGLFINDTQIVGIASDGNFMKQKNVFASIKPTKDTIQQMDSGSCDEIFVKNILKSKYNAGQARKFDNYYVAGNDYAILTDLCGNLLFENLGISSKSLASIEHQNGQYRLILSKPQMFLLRCGLHNGLNDELTSKCQMVEKEIIVFDDNNDKDASRNRKISLNGGKTFYHDEEEKLAMLVSLFTQQEIDEMPEDWRECLGIKK